MFSLQLGRHLLYDVLVCCRHCIEQSDLDGNNRQVVVEGIRIPESLAVFGHHVYWIDLAQCMTFTVNYL